FRTGYWSDRADEIEKPKAATTTAATGYQRNISTLPLCVRIIPATGDGFRGEELRERKQLAQRGLLNVRFASGTDILKAGCWRRCWATVHRRCPINQGFTNLLGRPGFVLVPRL